MSRDAIFEPLAAVSWVLEVLASTHGIAFRLDAVLTEEHPMYSEPRPGEQYCYRTAWRDLASHQPIDVALSGGRPAIDPDGSEDLGNIDRFEFDEHESRWVMEGAWGSVLMHDPTVTLRFE